MHKPVWIFEARHGFVFSCSTKKQEFILNLREATLNSRVSDSAAAKFFPEHGRSTSPGRKNLGLFFSLDFLDLR
jgi:hypothetical protein